MFLLLPSLQRNSSRITSMDRTYYGLSLTAESLTLWDQYLLRRYESDPLVKDLSIGIGGLKLRSMKLTLWNHLTDPSRMSCRRIVRLGMQHRFLDLQVH